MEPLAAVTGMFAPAVVVLTGLYFVGLASISLFAPARAARFLLGFAGSASAHYIELVVRIVVGGAFLLNAPLMLFPGAFVAFGWVLVITSICLFALPWKWHHRFAQKSVPHAVRHLRLIAIASFALGVFVLAAVVPW